MQGTHGCHDWPCEHGGLISARAGNTLKTLSPVSPGWAHPRLCGEHPIIRTRPFGAAGSSPPVRGAQSLSKTVAVVFGLIPACAGSTSSQGLQPPQPRAHPRLCGEHSPIFQGALTTVGSSPLARGTRLAICGLVAGLGLIPARAGNTWVFRRFRAWTWAHPRLCGEHMLRTDGTKDALGSSPPVRGARKK